ncbi:MAG TPA: glycosyl transferase family 36 [Ignavibacteria bacterium]
MKYGYFSENGKEFIITNVATPSPWINYIYNGRYFSTISNNGGGISYYKNPLHGRITRYRINDVPHDRPGKYIYIRDNDTNEIWSLTWQPVGKKVECYKIIHGFGYTISLSEIEEILSVVRFFVPLDDDREIWHAKITNKSSRIRNLSIFGYVEFALGHALIDIINQCDDQHFNRVYFDKELNSLFATKTYWVTETNGTQQQENKEWDRWAFFTSNYKISKYETLRERFIGLYRNENNPISIEKDSLSSKDTDFGNAVGALQIDIVLEPNEAKDIIFSLGVIPKDQFESLKENTLKKYNTLSEIENAFNKIKEKWDEYFSYTKIETPDNDTNIFMNYWIPYQAKVAFDIGRVASFYYWGLGRGFGFRDTSQDTIAITISDKAKAKERIILLSKQMRSDGKVYHHFFNDGQGEFTKHCDDPLWFILAVSDYIKETGDIHILEEKTQFLDGKEGSILDHLIAIITFVKNNLTKRNLPIFGRGDWNDTLDYIGGKNGGESVWGAMFYVAMINELIDLLNFANKSEYIPEITNLKNKINKSLEELCWDGKWFVRAFGENHTKIGSKDNKYGKIFINSQSWSVISQCSDKEKLITAMNSVAEHLDTEFGPKICAPAFREIDPKIGLITRCVRGKKENGAIFCHPVPWVIMAECLLKRGNKAYNYFKKILPNNIDSDIFVAEPYVFSQYITSNEHDSPGRASHSWQTGTAAWMYRVSYDYIAGIRSTYEGLMIDPVIPSSWKQIKIYRKFRNTLYVINVENPEGKESGIKSIEVNGKPISGNILPLTNEEKCNVRVIMG